MDDETMDRRTLLLWQAVTYIVAGMGVAVLIQNWEPIRSWLR